MLTQINTPTNDWDTLNLEELLFKHYTPRTIPFKQWLWWIIKHRIEPHYATLLRVLSLYAAPQTYDVYVPTDKKDLYEDLIAALEWLQREHSNEAHSEYIKGLSPQQADAFARLQSFLSDNAASEFVFSGYAGTGKSYTIVRFVRYCLSLGKTVMVLAPSHKAKNVLDVNLEREGIRVEVNTVASALCMLPRWKDGKQVFIHKPTSKSDLLKLDKLRISLVFVDEYSMLSPQAYSLLQRYTNKVVYLGDSAQLPCPQEDAPDVPVVLTKNINNPHKVQLTDVVRNHGSILQYCTYLRDNLCKVTLETLQYVNGTDLTIMSQEEAITAKAANAAARIITFRNVQADDYCTAVKEVLGITSEYAIGEVVYVVSEPIVHSTIINERKVSTVVANIQDEIEITDVNLERTGNGLLYYTITGTVLRTGTQVAFKVVAKQSHYMYAQLLQQLKAEAYKTRDWTAYIDMYETYSKVRHTHAITADSSQGSTYATVFLDYYDIMRGRDTLHRNKRLYVAASRASENLVLIM